MNHDRITWTAGPLSGSVRVPSHEVGVYVQSLRDQYGRTLRLTIEAA